MPPIEVSGLVVRYGDLTAVDGLSFTVDAGEVVALLGPNGAGKTTTVETLEGYRRPSGGHVRVLGIDPVSRHRDLVPRIGVMLQESGVYPGIRVSEAVRLFAAYYGTRTDADADALLRRVGLDDVAGRTWRHLSGGEQQRLSLALALVGRPEVAFLDEPTSGVDPSGRRVIRAVVRDLASDGVSVLLTTHELDEAERVADRVVIIDHGRLVAAGTTAELTAAAPAEQIRFAAPPGLDAAALGEDLGVAVEETEPGEYRIHAPPSPTTVALLTAWLAARDIPLLELQAGRRRLEDVFLRLTGGDR